MDLLYASFENNVFQTPFFISLDHDERCIVVAIRGTMSLRDAITDLSAEAKPLDYPGIPEGCKAHHGMLLAAKNTLEKINQLGTLNRAAINYPNYTVVITGHSLGGKFYTAHFLPAFWSTFHFKTRLLFYSWNGNPVKFNAPLYIPNSQVLCIFTSRLFGYRRSCSIL